MFKRNNGHMTNALPVEDPDHTRRVPTWVVDVATVVIILVATAILAPRPSGDPGLQGPPGKGGEGGGRIDGGFFGNGAFDDGGFGVHWAIIPITTVIAAALILLRRRWPLAIFTAVFSVYIFTVVLGVPVVGPGIAAIVAAYGVATRTSRSAALAVGIVGAGAVALLSYFFSGEMTLDPQIFQIAAGIAIATALGDSTRSRRAYTAAVTERAERAEQTREAVAQRRVAEERLRIAQDLHDTVAHRISVISLNAGVASSALDTNPDKSRESLGTIRTASREVLGEIGVLLRYLRAEEGVAAENMPQPGVDDLNALVTTMTGSGLVVSYDTAGDLTKIDELTGRVVYRVAQEGLTNANKHGSGGTVSLQIAVSRAGSGTGEDAVTVTVTNPVSETDRNQPDAPRGQLGLTGLRERVSAIGGSVSAGAPGSDGTFTLRAELPLRRKESL
jgi:signal transduction histidine kinase